MLKDTIDEPRGITTVWIPTLLSFPARNTTHSARIGSGTGVDEFVSIEGRFLDETPSAELTQMRRLEPETILNSDMSHYLVVGQSALKSNPVYLVNPRLGLLTSRVCVRTWSVSVELFENPLPQYSQMYGVSPVWTRSWFWNGRA